ncbi:MAG: 2,3-bisphosphoglycerate-independent phosphoglycerate mutase [Thermoplasmatota archaeon]
MDDKILIVIFDGIGDRPVEKFEGKTPLEQASTPNLDELASKGISGLMDTISPGVRPGSDTGHLAILGYDPYEVYTGRGPFEAAGIGVELEPNDVAFRCNFGTYEDGKIVDRRAGRIKEDTDEIAKVIREEVSLDVDFEFEHAVEHRAVLVLKGEGLSGDIIDIDPHETGVDYHKPKMLVDSPENQKTADILSDFTQQTIEVLTDLPINKKRKDVGKLPANIILSRGAGKAPKMKDLKELKGVKGAAISGIPLVRGVCRLAGMDIIDVPGATGGMDTDVESIMKATRDSLKDYDLLMVNIKGTDLSGHDGLPEQKKDFIEKIDDSIKTFDEIKNVYCAFTGDHSTPVSIMDHSGDPLPLTICGEQVRVDDVTEFNERACSKGGLCRIKGKDLLNILLDLSDRAEKFGA